MILIVAGLNFAVNLGSSSYFTDEAFSVIHALPSLGTLFKVVARSETTPWTYFLFLHEWMLRTGSQAEWVTRLPSVAAGVALIGLVYWMALAFVSRRAALGAAALAAISPLIQAYAQETRVYIFLMVALVVAVGATVRAVRKPDARVGLLVLGALASFVTIWLHYTAALVIFPLAVWVATRTELLRRERTGFIIAAVAGVASVMPLLLEQYGYFPNGGAISGGLNWSNSVSVIGTPFGLRVGTPINLWSIAGAAIMVCAVVILLLSARRKEVFAPRLLAALAIVGVIALFALDLAGKHILITRYTAATAPFAVTAIAAACAILPRAAAVVLAGATVAASAAGLIVNHSPSGFYAPARQVVEYLAPRRQPRDVLITTGFPLADVPIFYYDTRLLRPKQRFIGLGDAHVPVPFRRRSRRIWIVDSPASATRAAAIAIVEPLLRAHRYRVANLRLYTTSITLAVMLVVPERHTRPGAAPGEGRQSRFR